MLGNILYQTLMFLIIWDIYLRLGGRNTQLYLRILFLLFDLALCVWGELIARYLGLNLPMVPLVTLGFSYYLNQKATPVERFFLGFYPVVLVDLARRFLATFFFPSLLGMSAYVFNNDIWWSMLPLAFVLPTVHFVDFLLQIDFADVLKVVTRQEKNYRLGMVNMALLSYYSLVYLISAFDVYFPNLQLENTLRLPLVLGYLYLLLFVVGTVNQFAKEKISQDLTMEQSRYLDDLKRENARVEGLYKDLMQTRSNYELLLNNLREVERTGDIKATKRDLIELYVHQDKKTISSRIKELDNVFNPNIYSLLTSKYHEAQIYGIHMHAEVPEPVTKTYLTELDLAITLGHLMDNAMETSRKVKDGFIHVAYFEDEDSQSFIIESAILEEGTSFDSLVQPASQVRENRTSNLISEVLERYPNTSFSTRIHNHKMMQMLEMRP